MQTHFNDCRWNTFSGILLVITAMSSVASWGLAEVQAIPPTGESPIAKPLSAVLEAMPDFPSEAVDEGPEAVNKATQPVVEASEAVDKATKAVDELVNRDNPRLAEATGLSVSNVLRGDAEQREIPPEVEHLIIEPPTLAPPEKSGHPQQPMASLSKRIEIDPVDAEQAKLWIVEAHELGRRAITESQFARVIELCDKAIAAELTNEIRTYAQELAAWAYNRRGEQRADAGQDEDALTDFIAAIQRDPEHWKAIHNRGVSYAQAGNLKEAFDDFCQTIELCPNHAKAYSNRGALYEESGDLAAALDDYRRAIELDPMLAFAHAGRGRTSHRLRRLDVARDELNEAIRLIPDNAAFYTSRADLFADMGDYSAALADYGKAVELNPVLAEAYRNGAWLLATCPDAQFRDTENAVIGAEKAIELAGGERHLYLDTLAAAQANAGDFDSAVQTAEFATENAPDAYRAFFKTRLDMYKAGKPFRTK